MRIFLLLSIVALSAAPLHAQAATVPPCDGPPLTDTTATVFREIRSVYSSLALAMRREDLEGLAALYSPDLVVRTPTGQTWDYQQSLAYSRAGFAQVDSTILISNRIVALRVCGTRATATVLQQWGRIQRVAGVPRRRETVAVQDETWIRTASGWKRALIEHIVTGVAYDDGRPVEPTPQ